MAEGRVLPQLTRLEVRGAISHGRLGGDREVYELLDGRLFRVCAAEDATTAFPSLILGKDPVPLQPVAVVGLVADR